MVLKMLKASSERLCGYNSEAQAWRGAMPKHSVESCGEDAEGVFGALISGICYRITERAEVVKWQTRYVQGVVSISSCGFKSHLRQTLVTLVPMRYA
jgi:hypothetical protein